jgi:hypothetical protein
MERTAGGSTKRRHVRFRTSTLCSIAGAIGLVALTWSTSAAVASPSQFAGNSSASIAGKIAPKFAELTPSDGAGGDEFGEAVAFSGSTMVIGAPYHNSQAGAAYVFTKSATTPSTWSQTEELTEPSGPTANDYFGYSAAIYKNEIVIGSLDSNAGVGAAYVFTGSGSTWTDSGTLTPSHGVSGDFFAYTVAIQNKTIVVGTPNVNSTTGLAYIFKHRTVGWVQTQKLKASDAAPDSDFGYSLSLAGPELLVGAFGAADRNGRGYVFTIGSTGRWSQQAELAANDAGEFGGDDFGISVAIAGHTAILGASNHNAGDGAVYVFGGSGTTWSQEKELTGGDVTSNSGFGSSLGLSGTTLLVGNQPASASPEAVYVFSGSGSSWSQVQEIKAPKSDSLGSWGPVALSRKTALVGAQGANGNIGAAYVN